jgi:hypothetical protein
MQNFFMNFLFYTSAFSDDRTDPSAKARSRGRNFGARRDFDAGSRRAHAHEGFGSPDFLDTYF